jgi:hypothetical protein
LIPQRAEGREWTANFREWLSHDTQPWRFRMLDRGATVELWADRDRRLPINDPGDRELTLSCGCVLMNLRAAAAAAGLGTTISALPDPERPDLLARVVLRADAGPDLALAALASAIDPGRGSAAAAGGPAGDRGRPGLAAGLNCASAGR